MTSLKLKVPPPLVVFGTAMCMWLTAFMTPVVSVPFWIRLTGAGFLFVVGQAVAVAGILVFRRAKTTISPTRPGKATSLVATGIYRYTRNPMYLGLLVTLLAWGFFLTSPAALLFLPLFVAYIHRFQILPEERALARLFPADFAAYCREVRRWL